MSIRRMATNLGSLIDVNNAPQHYHAVQSMLDEWRTRSYRYNKVFGYRDTYRLIVGAYSNSPYETQMILDREKANCLAYQLGTSFEEAHAILHSLK